MSDRVNCELFQVRTGAHRLTVKRGLAITETGGKIFIDPQIEPGYNTSRGESDPEDLHLRLGKIFEEQQKQADLLQEISVHRTLLKGTKKGKDLLRYRASLPVPRPIGRCALVSVVSHDETNFPLIQRTVLLDRIIHSRQSRGGWLGVELYLVPEGGSVYVEHNTGEDYNYRPKTFKLTYQMGSDEGLLVRRFDPIRPTTPPDFPPSSSGDREPRSPLPSGSPIARTTASA